MAIEINRNNHMPLAEKARKLGVGSVQRFASHAWL